MDGVGFGDSCGPHIAKQFLDLMPAPRAVVEVREVSLQRSEESVPIRRKHVGDLVYAVAGVILVQDKTRENVRHLEVFCDFRTICWWQVGQYSIASFVLEPVPRKII